MTEQDLPPLLPPDPTIDGEHLVTNGRQTLRWRWRAETQLWEGPPGSEVEFATPEGAALVGFRLARAS